MNGKRITGNTVLPTPSRFGAVGVLRWCAVVPGGLLAGFLVLIPVGWILSGMGDSIQLYLSAIIGTMVFVFVGAMIAPKKRITAAYVLFGLSALPYLFLAAPALSGDAGAPMVLLLLSVLAGGWLGVCIYRKVARHKKTEEPKYEKCLKRNRINRKNYNDNTTRGKRFFCITFVVFFLSCVWLCLCINNDIIAIASHDRLDIPKGWTLYQIGETAKIALPPTLELRDKSSKYAVFVERLMDTVVDDYLKVHLGVDPVRFDLVFQPKDINSNDDDIYLKAKSRYARVLIKYEKGREGDYPRYRDKISSVELEEFNEAVKSKYFESAHKLPAGNYIVDAVEWKRTNKKPLKAPEENTMQQWYDAETGVVNGITFITFGYVRKGLNETRVSVREYRFFNSDESINVVVSYRISESDIWADDLAQIASTFNFMNRK